MINYRTSQMAVGFILIGLLLILPGSLFERVELNQNRQKLEKGENNGRYIAFLRNLRLLEQGKEWNQGEQHRQKKYQEPEKEDKFYEKAAKNLDTIEKDAIVEKADSQSLSPTTSSSKLAKSKDNDTSPSAPLPLISSNEKDKSKSLIAGSDLLFIGIVVACSFAGLVGLVMAGVCWYRLNKNIKAASEVDYPAYGVTGPTKERLGSGPGDRKLAQSAQMYHYQHQKQQMIAMEKANGEMKHDASEDESEEENEEGDYTVYECPGLAPTGEMEVRNPLFNEETPVSQDPPDDQKDKDTQ